MAATGSARRSFRAFSSDRHLYLNDLNFHHRTLNGIEEIIIFSTVLHKERLVYKAFNSFKLVDSYHQEAFSLVLG